MAGFFVDRVILKNEQGLGMGYFITSIVMELLLGMLAMTVVMWVLGAGSSGPTPLAPVSQGVMP